MVACEICGKPATRSAEVSGRYGTTSFSETFQFCDRHSLRECGTVIDARVREYLEAAPGTLVLQLHSGAVVHG